MGDKKNFGNKSEQAKLQSAQRLKAQKERGAPGFKDGSNPHLGGPKGQSGQQQRRG